MSDHSTHRSYLHPLSSMDISQVRQAAQTPLTSHTPPHHSPTRCQSLMELMSLSSHPPSRREIAPIPSHLLTPIRNPHTDICNTLYIYEQTRFNDLLFPIPQILVQAEYSQLYSYFAYELPFMPVWGKTQAGNDYFMKKQRGLPANDVLQYEAERNARLLFNEIHPDTLMQALTPYEDAIAEIN